jgi:acetate CoA/acetoacetate CoA-transferase beta subunit
MLVNLGIGIPSLVANHVAEGVSLFFPSENGVIGTGPIPEEGMAGPDAHRRGRARGERAAGRKYL